MRALVYKTIVEDPELNALGINPDTTFASYNAVSPDAKPFMVLRFGSAIKGFGYSKAVPLTVMAYDVGGEGGGDYSLIDSILRRARKILCTLTAAKDETGGWVSQIAWDGGSDDLADFGYQAITKNDSFTVVGSEVG